MTATFYDSAQTRTPIISPLRALWEYRGLLRLLVTRDLTVRYKRSFLGVWWTLLNPMLQTLVMWIVFGLIIDRFGGADLVEPYIVYLLAGVITMNFFSQTVLATGSAVRNASSILSKVYVPPEIFAFATSIAGAVNFVISSGPLILATLVAGQGVAWTVVLVPVHVLLLLAFVSGLGMIIASLAVYFYDVLDLTRVALQLTFYLTPVFWTESFLSDRFLAVVRVNPMYAYVQSFRDLFYLGEFPPLWQWLVIAGSALAALTLGMWMFGRSWRRLVAEL